MTEYVVLDGEGRPKFTIEAETTTGSAGPFATRALSVNDAVTDLQNVGEAIAETCAHIAGTVKSRLAEAHPHEFELTFGVKLGGEGGLPGITKVKGEATFEVRATWQRDS